MSKHLLKGALSSVLLTASMLSANADVTLNIDAASRGPRIGDLQYGIFYEEINNAGDGGLYAELLRNRNFEDAAAPDFWSAVGDATIKITTATPMNAAQLRSLDLRLTGANQGIANTGYWGINCVSGDEYALSFWIKSDNGYSGTVTARLVDDNGVGAEGSTTVTADGNWKQYTVKFTATANKPNAHFELLFVNAGHVQLDMVSLFPPTYKDRPNGCRRDLAVMLEELHPAFVRFPGGCYIEGSGTAEDNRRFEWKKTIGPVEERPGHYNYNWGYPSTDGLGFHEFLQLTEDLGAEPLFVVNIGLGHGYAIDYTKIDEYIREALDAIEYCNGDVNTTWGAKRAANGHPAPFNMRLVEVGNENYNYDDITSDHYAERYKAFYDAIKARWPEVTLIGNVEAWGTDDPSWRNSNHCEIVDEHYYRSPLWFEQAYKKYDNYDRSKPKVYAGEYAVTQDFGTNGHLAAALGEAVYCLGMERNSDHVIMASYAPIFMNEERDGGWMPDMIRFGHDRSYGTPSYWVQKMMPESHGKQNVNWTEDNNLRSAGARIALSSWSTSVKYDNVKVTDTDGNVVFSDDFSTYNSAAWTAPNGNWTVTDGVLKQSSTSEQGVMYAGCVDLPGSYTLELDATKLSGAEGFLVAFNYADSRNWCWWNIAGWNNGQHGLQVCANGGKTDFDLKAGSIETGRTYHLKLEVDGPHVKCYIDDKLIHDKILPLLQKVYVASSIDDDTSTLWLKVVNTTGESYPVNINMANAAITGGETTILTSASGTDENTTAQPENIVPQQGVAPELNGKGGATYTAPAYSLSVLKLSLGNVIYSGESGKEPTEAQVAAVKDELRSTVTRLGNLHSAITLPLSTASGATIEWNGTPSPYYTLNHSRFSTQMELASPNTGNSKNLLGTLTATVTYPDGARGDIEIAVNQAPADGMYGYLYAFMNPASETTNYALGTKEGLAKQFETLIDGEEVFDTKAMAPVEGGTRDAYMNRGEREGEYLMTVTDMSNIKSGRWENHAMSLMKSPDMIHWTTTSFDFNRGKSIFSDPDATVEDGFGTDAEYAAITQAWAPQFIKVGGHEGYLVYYSLQMRDDPRGTHHRIYYSWTNRDFSSLTQPRLLFDPGYAVIDADIFYNDYDNLYHMLIKKEQASADETGIFHYTSPALIAGDWKLVSHMKAEGNAAVEGPTTVRRIDEDVYNLSYMRYDAEYKYKVVDMDHLGTGYSASTAMGGDGNFQHGSIFTVTETEYNMLATWSKLVKTIKTCRAIKASTGTTIMDEAIAAAERAIEVNKSVESLAEQLPVALEKLLEARDAYAFSSTSEPDEDGYIDITSMITNSNFNANNGNGWAGTEFTAANAGVAEHWNKNYNTFQELADMPVGHYRLHVQGFYRYGWVADATAAHADGTEVMLANYYLGTTVGTFMSLYDEAYGSYPDNVWQATAAFNTDHKYNNEPIYYDLTERGPLKFGIRKTREIAGDWNCFDNFKLYYKAFEAGVDNVVADSDANAPVNVYSVTGALLRANVNKDEATAGLEPGVYIVGTDKVVVK